ncbi:hypothetical protein PIB30_076928 [Stylosanthes scabra]|uniref:Uncharacterized protein n=1 Tax=Stylosanthes scabra TaxID=79078 RepID=A0ABU6XNT7_9FABA|nr:hypothetical protein [Stylosanthes scabra]
MYALALKGKTSPKLLTVLLPSFAIKVAENPHQCLEEVEEENEDQEAEDVDHEVEDKDKEQKGMEIVHSASSEVTPSKLPSELQFEWVNFSNLNFIGPQHYGLMETDDQLKALCGVMDKKEMDSLWLDESRFITCGKPKIRCRPLLKLHNNRGKIHKAMGGLTKFGIPEKVTRINTFGDLLLIWEFLRA